MSAPRDDRRRRRCPALGPADELAPAGTCSGSASWAARSPSTCAWSASFRCSPTRPLIVGVVELGQAALLIAFAACGYLAARPFAATSRVQAVVAGAFVGAIIGRLPDRAGAARLGRRHPGGLPECVPGPVRPAARTAWARRGAWFPILVGAITGAIAGVRHLAAEP